MKTLLPANTYSPMYLSKVQSTHIAKFVLQLPWMQHGQDVVADSRFIIKYLQNTYGSRLKLQEPQDSQSQAISTWFSACVKSTCTSPVSIIGW